MRLANQASARQLMGLAGCVLMAMTTPPWAPTRTATTGSVMPTVMRRTNSHNQVRTAMAGCPRTTRCRARSALQHARNRSTCIEKCAIGRSNELQACADGMISARQGIAFILLGGSQALAANAKQIKTVLAPTTASGLVSRRAPTSSALIVSERSAKKRVATMARAGKTKSVLVTKGFIQGLHATALGILS
jgi:hypothetical protein